MNDRFDPLAILAVILAALAAGVVCSIDFDNRPAAVDCSMSEWHPDLVKYRDACRDLRPKENK